MEKTCLLVAAVHINNSIAYSLLDDDDDHDDGDDKRPNSEEESFFGHRFSFFVSLYGHKEFYEDFCISRFLCNKSDDDDDGGDVQLKSLRTWLVFF